MNAAKEYLLQIQEIDSAINRTRMDIADIRARLQLHGISYDGDRVQVSPVDKMADAFGQIAILEQQQKERIAKLKRKRDSINLMIDKLPEPYAKLLNLRYCHINSLEAVARKMGYSFAWTRHLHGKALDMFSQMYGKEIEQWKLLR